MKRIDVTDHPGVSYDERGLMMTVEFASNHLVVRVENGKVTALTEKDMPLFKRKFKDWPLTKLLMKTQLFWLGDYFKKDK